MLRWMLMYKAESAGRQVAVVSPAGTSQECSACGAIVRKMLSERIHHCDCGLVVDRDVNAARNILARGLRLLRRGDGAIGPLRRPEKIGWRRKLPNRTRMVAQL
jgi:putative transposase